jgi:hypothetical protein
MFYAVRLCGNPGHPRYMRPVEFMTEEVNDSRVPIECFTENEMIEKLKDYSIYKAGWVEIIEIS